MSGPVAGELCLSFPAAADTTPGPPILIISPLFDEANRMRRTLVLTMRALAARGHDTHLPDLPGQNDSLVSTDTASLDGWRAALADYADGLAQPPLIASWRGGALIDDAARPAIGWWRMAPLAGNAIVRALLRVRIAADRENGTTTTMESLRADAQAAGMVNLSGNLISAGMIAALDAASPAPVTPVVERAPSDVAGSALWLRSEPGEDAGMAVAMAADISEWARKCAAG